MFLYLFLLRFRFSSALSFVIYIYIEFLILSSVFCLFSFLNCFPHFYVYFDYFFPYFTSFHFSSIFGRVSVILICLIKLYCVFESSGAERIFVLFYIGEWIVSYIVSCFRQAHVHCIAHLLFSFVQKSQYLHSHSFHSFNVILSMYL